MTCWSGSRCVRSVLLVLARYQQLVAAVPRSSIGCMQCCHSCNKHGTLLWIIPRTFQLAPAAALSSHAPRPRTLTCCAVLCGGAGLPGCRCRVQRKAAAGLLHIFSGTALQPAAPRLAANGAGTALQPLPRPTPLPMPCKLLSVSALQQGVLTLRLGDLGTYVINKQVCSSCQKLGSDGSSGIWVGFTCCGPASLGSFLSACSKLTWLAPLPRPACRRPTGRSGCRRPSAAPCATTGALVSGCLRCAAHAAGRPPWPAVRAPAHVSCAHG